MKAKTSRPNLKRISPALVASIAALGASAQAQLSIADTAGSYVIDFDNTLAGVNSGAWAGTGFEAGTTTSGRLDSNAWAVTGWSNGNLVFGGTQTTANTDYTRGATSAVVTTGGMYAFSGGAITTGVALGFQPGGSDWAPGTLTLRVKNDSVSLITGFSLAYKIWVRNDQARANSFNFSRSPDDTTYSPELGLDFISTAAADPTPVAFALVTRSLTISNLSLAAGGFYYLRWSGADAGGSGSRDEFALDDIQLSAFTTGVAGRSLVWSPITGVWDTTSLNWSENGTATAFQTNDTVTFGDDGLATGANVTIQTAGVTIGNVRVTNTTGTYAFTGGAIGGSGSITKSGGGKLVLSSANSYTGGTIVSGGTISVSADNQLGSTTGGILLSGASTLETTGSLTLNSGRALTGSGIISIAPSTTLNIAGAANTGVITLSNTGSLLLSGSVSAQLGGLVIQQPAIIGASLPILLNGSTTTSNTVGTVLITGPLSLGGALRVFNIADGTDTLDVSITGNIVATNASGRLHKLGDGTLALFGDNSGMMGGVRLGPSAPAAVTGGTLIVNSAASLGPGGSGTAGAFQFNAGTLRTTAPIQFPATLALSLGGSAPLASAFDGFDVEFLGAAQFFTSPAQNIIVANSNVRFASPLTGTTAGLTVRGTGSLTLASGGTFVSDVVVESGKLIVLGNLGGPAAVDNRPAITVIANGTLSGSVSGSDGSGNPLALGSLIAGDLGTISPGTAADSTAILTAIGTISPVRDALSVLTNGILAMDIGGVDLGDYDQIAANGSVTLGGGLNLSITGGFVPVFENAFTLISNDDVDPVSNFFFGKPENSTFMAGGYEFRINYAAGDGNDVIVTAVPEPGCIALILGGLGFFGLSRRRKS